MKAKLVAVGALLAAGVCVATGNLVAVSIVANGAAMSVRHASPGKRQERFLAGLTGAVLLAAIVPWSPVAFAVAVSGFAHAVREAI